MKRLGKFTKTIYDENYDFSNCPECCTCLTDEEANDEEFINKHHIKDLMDCVACMGCPASQNKEETKCQNTQNLKQNTKPR